MPIWSHRFLATMPLAFVVACSFGAPNVPPAPPPAAPSGQVAGPVATTCAQPVTPQAACPGPSTAQNAGRDSSMPPTAVPSAAQPHPAPGSGAAPSSAGGAGESSATPAGGAGKPAATPARAAPDTAWDPALGPHLDQEVGATVRFIAVGDTGTGGPAQQAVADAMANKCAREGCDFVVLLGDNIYEAGPRGTDDAQWQSKFEAPFAALDMPFYAVLGNHDVTTSAFFGTGYDPSKTVSEVEYTKRSRRWHMPAAFYSLSAGNVGLLLIDTPALYQAAPSTAKQAKWVGPARDALRQRHAWVLSAGHHTYVSNGIDHGNAGSYAGPLESNDGSQIKLFFEDHLCGHIDLALTAHDHTRQWLDPSLCAGTEVIVSGAGGKSSGLRARNKTLFESLEFGFLYIVATEHELLGQFVTKDGQVDFEHRIVH